MKQLMFFLILVFSITEMRCQLNETEFNKNSLGGQLGGQVQIGLVYERSFLSKKTMVLNGQIGIGLNQNGDYEYDGTLATYSLQTGLNLLAGPRPFFLEIAPLININWSGSHSFANLNSWIGLRYVTEQSFFLGIGYTPIIYRSFTESSNYADIWFSLKLGGHF